jgi:hypothetical protein
LEIDTNEIESLLGRMNYEWNKKEISEKLGNKLFKSIFPDKRHAVYSETISDLFNENYKKHVNHDFTDSGLIFFGISTPTRLSALLKSTGNVRKAY